MLSELLRREKEANIKPDPDLDIFMKVWWQNIYGFLFMFVFVNMNGFNLVGGLDSGAGGQCNDWLYYEGNFKSHVCEGVNCS